MNQEYKSIDIHPLRIYEIPVGNKGGLIGLSLCPGKTAVGPSGNGCRDMVKDVAAIRSWGASDVLSLLELQELMELAVMTLPETLAAAGIEWHHLPITEGKAPCKGFDDMWKGIGTKLRTRLLEGRRVVIHCRGEFGRAETIAAKIMIETGHTPEAAIMKIRTVRGSQALQSLDQIKYLFQLSI